MGGGIQSANTQKLKCATTVSSFCWRPKFQFNLFPSDYPTKHIQMTVY